MRALRWIDDTNQPADIPTTAFPFTGGAKFDPRNAPAQTRSMEPLYYRWLTSNGKEGVEPIEPLKRIMQLIDAARAVGRDGQVQAAQGLFRIWADNVLEIGTLGLTPMVPGVVVINSKMHDVPATIGITCHCVLQAMHAPSSSSSPCSAYQSCSVSEVRRIDPLVALLDAEQIVAL